MNLQSFCPCFLNNCDYGSVPPDKADNGLFYSIDDFLYINHSVIPVTENTIKV